MWELKGLQCVEGEGERERGGGKWFAKVRSINYFTPPYTNFPWSTENIFSLIDIFNRPKHPKIGKNVFIKRVT
jgi:hypothetical protein